MMVKAAIEELHNYPEYGELLAFLALAKKTWPQYGLSAPDLAIIHKQDPYLFDLIEIIAS